jgi:hypothetical protein
MVIRYIPIIWLFHSVVEKVSDILFNASIFVMTNLALSFGWTSSVFHNYKYLESMSW